MSDTTERMAQAFERLQSLCGHTQNSSDQTVIINQDDATRTYHIRLGSISAVGNKARTYWGMSLMDVINKAFEGETK